MPKNSELFRYKENFLQLICHLTIVKKLVKIAYRDIIRKCRALLLLRLPLVLMCIGEHRKVGSLLEI